MQSGLNSGSMFDDSIMLHWSYGAKSPGHGVASKHRKDFYGSEVTLQRNSNNAYIKFDETTTDGEDTKERLLPWRIRGGKSKTVKFRVYMIIFPIPVCFPLKCTWPEHRFNQKLNT